MSYILIIVIIILLYLLFKDKREPLSMASIPLNAYIHEGKIHFMQPDKTVCVPIPKIYWHQCVNPGYYDYFNKKI